MSCAQYVILTFIQYLVYDFSRQVVALVGRGLCCPTALVALNYVMHIFLFYYVCALIFNGVDFFNRD